MSTAQAVEDRAKFDFVRYANCWEDPLLLLGVMPPQARCLSIASAGDNSFSLLCGGAASVTAFDLNRAQLDLCELKAAAFRTLPHAEFLRFLGFAEATGEERIALYRGKVRAALAPSAIARYDADSPLLERGVVDAGKFESYFRIFANRILPLTHTRAERRELLRAKGLEERRAFFRGTWANMRYRLLFKLFFNKWVMGRLGRDPEFFRYVKKTAISGEIWKRAERAMSELPTEDNPYLRYVILGTFDGVLPCPTTRVRRTSSSSARASTASASFRGLPRNLPGRRKDTASSTSRTSSSTWARTSSARPSTSFWRVLRRVRCSRTTT